MNCSLLHKNIFLSLLLFNTFTNCLSDSVEKLFAQRCSLSQEDVKKMLEKEGMLTFKQAIAFFDTYMQKQRDLKRNMLRIQKLPHDLQLLSIKELLSQKSEVSYIPCYESYSFLYKPFSLSEFPEMQPYQGTYEQPFVAIIPGGKVASEYGFVMSDNKLVAECLSQGCPLDMHVHFLNQISLQKLKHISGRVAVLTRVNTDCYAHWMCDILPRLAFLQKSGVEYDYIYVPTTKRYMKNTLTLLGIDESKILSCNQYPYIQADQLIFPSLTARREIPLGEYATLCEYMPYWTIDFLRESFLPKIENMQKDFSKKIFISRQDGGSRKMMNEDEIFAEFEKKGFVRYQLSKLSFLEQVYLFHQADTVVGAHGAGLMNIVFCRQGTKIIEIFQARSTCTFSYLSESLGLDYTPVKTMKFLLNGFVDTSVSVNMLHDVLSAL